MTNAIDNARKALDEYDETAATYRDGMIDSMAAALRDLLGSLEYEYAIHSSKGEHLYPVDEQDRPMTTTLEEAKQALGNLDPDYWDADDVIVKRVFGEWERVS